MSNKAFVDILNNKALESASSELFAEISTVQSMLNMTPTVKDRKTQQWVASPVNLAVTLYQDTMISLISDMVESGLSYANKDYYIYVQFGNKPTISKSPNGMIKAASKLAEKRGYLANINKGCVYGGYKTLSVKRNGHIDTLELENSPESEIQQPRAGDIIAPYAVCTLINKKGVVVSRKVCIVRNNEFVKAKSQSKNQLHNQYPVPMAEKIAVKRLCQEMLSMLGAGDQEAEDLQSEIEDHNNDYDMDTKTKENQQEDKGFEDTISQKSSEKISEILDTLSENALNTFNSVLEKRGTPNLGDVLEKDVAGLMKYLNSLK